MLEIAIFKITDNSPISEVYCSINQLDTSSYEGLILSLTKNTDLRYHELVNEKKEKILLVYGVQSLFKDYHESLQVKVHEIKNLLTVVVSSSLLMLKIIKKGKIEEKMDFIKRSLGDVDLSVQSIIVNLNGIKKLFVEEEKNYFVKINDFLKTYESEIHSLCEQNNIKYKFTVGLDEKDHVKAIETKGVHINQVCINLLKNSIYSLLNSKRESKELEVSVSSFENNLVVTIEDNGDGISENLKEKIFEFGFTTKGDEGSGLGLALCKKVMTDSNGDLILEETSSEGAKFKFYLPVV